MGRPATGQRRKERIPLEVTPEEKAAIRAWAQGEGFDEVNPALRWFLKKHGILPTGTISPTTADERAQAAA